MRFGVPPGRQQIDSPGQMQVVAAMCGQQASGIEAQQDARRLVGLQKVSNAVEDHHPGRTAVHHRAEDGQITGGDTDVR